MRRRNVTGVIIDRQGGDAGSVSGCGKNASGMYRESEMIQLQAPVS